jgi:inosine-uridine nucleoside N-ribohydrolase
MKNLLMMMAALTLLLPGCGRKTATGGDAPQAVIFETDLGNDVDDALALDLLYKYMDAGKIRLLAVNLNKNGVAPAEYADILNTWYGYPDIPIGIIRDGADCETDAAVNYAKAVVDMKDADGNPLFARSHPGYADYPEAVTLYRKLLAAEPDASVVIASVGFSTNLIRLLETPADDISPLNGKELVAKKVKLLVTMAGCINNPKTHEYNVVKDIPAAKVIFEHWPTPVVTSPFEVGVQIRYPATSIENDFAWAGPHPVVEAYKAYLPMPYNRPTWDPTAVLYAVEGGDWFTVSPAGRIEVTEEGSTLFTEDPSGTRRYLSVTEEQSKAILDHFIEVITSHPAGR